MLLTTSHKFEFKFEGNKAQRFFVNIKCLLNDATEELLFPLSTDLKAKLTEINIRMAYQKKKQADRKTLG